MIWLNLKVVYDYYNLVSAYIDISDVAPVGDTLEEANRNLDVITDLALTLQNKTGIRPLWVTCNLFSHPRYLLIVLYHLIFICQFLLFNFISSHCST